MEICSKLFGEVRKLTEGDGVSVRIRNQRFMVRRGPKKHLILYSMSWDADVQRCVLEQLINYDSNLFIWVDKTLTYYPQKAKNVVSFFVDHQAKGIYSYQNDHYFQLTFSPERKCIPAAFELNSNSLRLHCNLSAKEQLIYSEEDTEATLIKHMKIEKGVEFISEELSNCNLWVSERVRALNGISREKMPDEVEIEIFRSLFNIEAPIIIRLRAKQTFFKTIPIPLGTPNELLRSKVREINKLCYEKMKELKYAERLY